MSEIAKVFILIDGNSLLFRSFYGVRAFTTTDGTPTNAIYGVAQMLLRILDMQPEYIAVAFDTPKPTFRHEEYEEYKAHRKPIPDDLVPQLSISRVLFEGFNIPVIECEGYEADDIIGTLAHSATQAGINSLIVTGDLDSLQLINERTQVMTTVKGVTETVIYDAPAVIERFGVPPELMTDFKGLKGDPSDNIPGVPGVGDKTAASLIKKYGTVEEILDHIDEMPQNRVRKNLNDNRDLALLSKRLSTIVLDVPVDTELDSYRTIEPDYDALKDLFISLEFRNLLRRLPDFAAEDISQSAQTEQVTCTTIADDDAASRLLTSIRSAGEFAFSMPEISEDSEQSGIYISLEQGECFYLGRQASQLGVSQPGLDFGEEEPEHDMLVNFSEVFSDQDIGKTCHNAKSAYHTLAPKGIDLRGLTFDTMLAAYVIDPTRGSSEVGDIASSYLHVQLTPEQQQRADVLLQLKATLQERMDEDELTDLFTGIELPLSRVLFEMEQNGILIDQSQLEELSARITADIAEVENRVYEAAGSVFNIGSPKQLQTVLFDQLGLKSSKKTKTGYSTSASVLEEMAHDYPIVADILKYRELSKIKSTYADALPLLVSPKTGRIHTTLNQNVTATGRLSSSEPNLQNIPIRTELGREIRRAFTAGQGNMLVSADYSQIELRVMAHFAEDAAMIEAFEQDKDIHRATACTLFGCTEDEVTSEMRRRAKTINFAVIYGMADFTLGRELDISTKEAKDYIESYFAKFPGVLEYSKQTIESCKEEGYVRTLLGRRRYIADINNSNFNIRSAAERAAVNTPIQGSAADIMKIAMLRVSDALHESGVRSKLLLQVHDELLVEAPVEEAKLVAGLLKREMEAAYELKAPLKVDVKIGQNWADMS